MMAPSGNLAETTLETSGKDFTLHSKRVGKISNYTRNEWRRCAICPRGKYFNRTLCSDLLINSFGHINGKLHSKWVYFIIFSTRNECILASFPLETGVFLHLNSIHQEFTQKLSRKNQYITHVWILHSFRVEKIASSPPVSSVVQFFLLTTSELEVRLTFTESTPQGMVEKILFICSIRL